MSLFFVVLLRIICKHLKRQEKNASENVVCWSRMQQIIA